MRILLADDDARIGKHIRQALIAEGYAVDYAEDGDEALWLAENNTYDAIILDVMMPLRDGFTIARSLPERIIKQGEEVRPYSTSQNDDLDLISRPAWNEVKGQDHRYRGLRDGGRACG